MEDAVIIDAVRTAGGKRNGSLKDCHPVELAADVLKAIVERNDMDPGLIDDVIMGCVSQVGSQGANIGRYAALAAGFPEEVPATTIDRQCGSSQQALHFAAQAVMSGMQDVVVAAGVEVMSLIPMGANISNGPGRAFGPTVKRRYAERGGLVNQGIAAELIAKKWGITREDADRFSVESHRRAAVATEQGRFDNEIIPISMDSDGETRIFDRDEGIRPDSSLERLATLKPAFQEGGIITAGNSSQITDGASAALVMSERTAVKLGLKPRARVNTLALAGVDPIMMLTGPIPATVRALERSQLRIDDIDRIEINEAFAPVVLAWERELRPDMEKVNVNGGAIALGHPLGASGTRLLATLINELERSGGRFGLQTMCEGGGMANATIIERLG
jgi:acetyl-CoA acyltransferase